ncbi:hypothetical protein AB0910_12540 [Streptomyces sp. NPDC047002]|uniref:hypothetical protein n=1 Tax=Streptomyces sp. NPDC047002 TaxID=3155475 RepID=UPI0034558047
MTSDDDLIRFHNGDTLDSIPVVRIPPASAPRRRIPVPLVAGVLALAVAAGIGGSALAHHLDRRATAAPAARTADPQQTTAAAASSPAAVRQAPACRTVHFKAESGPASCKSVPDICAPGAPWYTVDIDSLCGAVGRQAVRIVASPATGGDASSSYCIAWTGTGDGATREAALLMNAPAVSCTDQLVTASTAQGIDPTGQGVFYAEPQQCAPAYPGTRSTFPAVLLDYDTGPVYVCLTADNGA